MNQPVYKTTYSSIEDRYVFESIGKNGKILNVVKFFEVDDDIYNLGFGDFNPITDQIDDEIVSDNGDMVKVLSTVVSLVIVFFNENPMASISFKGSTPLRTQLYQRIINHYFEEFIPSFEIFGFENGIIQPFQKNKSYESFLVRKLL
jgi:hypothetical protein